MVKVQHTAFMVCFFVLLTLGPAAIIFISDSCGNPAADITAEVSGEHARREAGRNAGDNRKTRYTGDNRKTRNMTRHDLAPEYVTTEKRITKNVTKK